MPASKTKKSKAKNTLPKTIYHGSIPGTYGYGITCLSHTREGALRVLRKSWNEWKKDSDMEDKSVDEAMEYFGGGIVKIEIDKAYNDALRS